MLKFAWILYALISFVNFLLIFTWDTQGLTPTYVFNN